MRIRGWLFLVVLLASLRASAQPSLPRPPDETRAQARAYFEQGIRFFNVGDYPHALEAFKQGYLVKPDPAFLFNIGQCHRMMRNFEEEAHAYRAFLREQPEAPNRPEVEKFIAAAEAEMSRRTAAVPLAPPPTLGGTSATLPARPGPEKPPAILIVESTPPGALVRLDDPNAAPMGKTPLRLTGMAPGAHLVFLNLDGRMAVEKAIKIAAGEQVRLSLELPPVAAAAVATAPTPGGPAPEKHGSRGWIAGVVVAAVVVVGAGVAAGAYFATRSPDTTTLPTVGTP